MGKVMALLKELFAADEAYGCGFYNDDRWIAAYEKLEKLSQQYEEKRNG